MAGTSLDIIDHTYRLLYYSSKGDTAALKRTLEEGATPDAADYDNRTALHLAASEGHSSVVELLLEYKANVNPVDRWNRTVRSINIVSLFVLITRLLSEFEFLTCCLDILLIMSLLEI